MQLNLKSSAVLLLLFLNGLMISSCNGQSTPSEPAVTKAAVTESIKWMSFEEAVTRSRQKPRKIFIDVYTSWCGWCKKMDKTTFAEDSVISYMNANYYAVKLDAETKDTIHFNEKHFVYQPEYKANELAISLLSGKMGYPSYVFLDENFGMLTPPVQSYMTKEDLMPLLTFFGDNIYKNKTWEEYHH
jgi:thioredoxin-related protein